MSRWTSWSQRAPRRKRRAILQEEKAHRDWMNCLGYYMFAFGGLKIGFRVNTSVADAFNLDGM
jgi:hypothetical protein